MEGLCKAASQFRYPTSIWGSIRSRMRRVVDLGVRSESGSATTEFVILVLPLFIPVILLVTFLSSAAQSKLETGQIARTAIRAFITAPNTVLGHARVEQVLSTHSKPGAAKRFSYQIECQYRPCIQPMNRIRLTIEDLSRGVRVSTGINVDKWITAEAGFVATDEKLLFGFKDGVEIEEKLSPILEVKEMIDDVREILGK
jgi:hypothetical protein